VCSNTHWQAKNITMKNTFILLLLALILGSSACEKSEYFEDGEYFYLKNKGAVMPIWVKGNLASKVFILTVHGGPGASGHEFMVTKSFQTLEQDYAVIYWDQRFSGMSQGDPKNSTISVDQFVEDLDQVVDLIRQRYQDPKIFLLGHSWGGGLGTAWVGRGNNQSKIKGWIDMDGSKYDSLEMQAVKAWVLERVPAKIAEGKDLKFWNYVLEWYQQNPNPVYADKEPYIFTEALNTVFDGAALADTNQINYSKLFLKSPFSLAYFTKKLDVDFANGIDFRPEMRNIRIPSLVLWGADDPTLPLPLADFTYRTLGTEPAKKQKVIFTQCGHSPYYEKPTAFVASVRGFIEKWK
jgi:pimeloyl-ACP methyl ester carboxylesterase